MFTSGYGTLGYVALSCETLGHGCSEPRAPRVGAPRVRAYRVREYRARAYRARTCSPHRCREHRRPDAGGARVLAVSVGDCPRMCQEKRRDASAKPARAPQSARRPLRPSCPPPPRPAWVRTSAAGRRVEYRIRDHGAVTSEAEPPRARGGVAPSAALRVASRLQRRATAVSVWLMAAEERCRTSAPHLGARLCRHALVPSAALTGLTPRSAGRVSEVRLS
jgi:hypothetical protein